MSYHWTAFDAYMEEVHAVRRRCFLMGVIDRMTGGEYRPRKMPLTPAGHPLKFYLEAYDEGYGRAPCRDDEREFYRHGL